LLDEKKKNHIFSQMEDNLMFRENRRQTQSLEDGRGPYYLANGK
jgi:hypothetical protein